MSKRRNPRQNAAPKREKVRDIFVARPFEGLTDETEWIALRELVPAASAPLTLKPEVVEEYGDRPVTLSTVLPLAWPAMPRCTRGISVPNTVSHFLSASRAASSSAWR